MLRCKCGGSVAVLDVVENEDSVFESYRCVECGSTGNMRKDFITNATVLSGCLKEVR